MKPVGKA